MPGCQKLASDARDVAGCNARVAVLFSNGHFGVWELDPHNELQFVSMSPGCRNLQKTSLLQENHLIIWHSEGLGSHFYRTFAFVQTNET